MLEYSPTVTGHLCKCRWVGSRALYKGRDAAINREREHSLYSPTVEPTVRYCSSLSRHRVRRFSIYCTAGACEEHFTNTNHSGIDDDRYKYDYTIEREAGNKLKLLYIANERRRRRCMYIRVSGSSFNLLPLHYGTYVRTNTRSI